MRRITLCCLAVAGLALSPAASAQSIEARLRQQLVETTAQLRQAQDDQAAMQAQKVAAERERDTLKRQLAAAQAEVERLRHGGGPESEKMKDALNQAAAAAQQSSIERDQAQDAARKQGSLLAACQAKNDRLYKVAGDILNSYQNMDLGDGRSTRYRIVFNWRTALENAAQNYGDAIYDSKFDPRVAPPPQAAEPKPGEQVPPKP